MRRTDEILITETECYYLVKAGEVAVFTVGIYSGSVTTSTQSFEERFTFSKNTNVVLLRVYRIRSNKETYEIRAVDEDGYEYRNIDCPVADHDAKWAVDVYSRVVDPLLGLSTESYSII